MNMLTHTADTPDVSYGVTLIAHPSQMLSTTERANVAQWQREAAAQLREAGAGVPTHCSKVIIELCRLVQQLTGEGFRV